MKLTAVVALTYLVYANVEQIAIIMLMIAVAVIKDV